MINLLKGDNLQLLKTLEDNSIDSIVTDPPYALTSIVKRFGKAGSATASFGKDGIYQRASRGFMGKEWDAAVPTVEFWKEVYRVLKPGGHVLSFGGTRTYHRMVVNIEDAGFEIRDQLQWLYGSGFPKSLNIGKAVDKIQGNEREVVGNKGSYRDIRNGSLDVQLTSDRNRIDIELTKGNSPYEGWGTGLKPANEPICLARKPISEKTVALNVLKWGTGGINIDGCRIGSDDLKLGRFPSNLILGEDAAEELDRQSGVSKSKSSKLPLPITTGNIFQNTGNTNIITERGHNDSGGTSRFFYVAKVSRTERNSGVEHLDDKKRNIVNGGHGLEDSPNFAPRIDKNHHPTVKPIKLMTYLCRLITPKGGIVLDPFMGSGSTGMAAKSEGFKFVGMEMDEEYFKIAEARIKNYEK